MYRLIQIVPILFLLAGASLIWQQGNVTGSPSAYQVLVSYEEPGGGETVYAKDKNHVYIDGVVNTSLDPATTVAVGTYIKDKNIVFDAGSKLQGVIDAPTFSYLSGAFYKDKNNFYCFAQNVLNVADPSTFLVVGGDYAKDSKYVYSSYNCGSLTNSDPKTFTRISGFYDFYAKDKNNAYMKGTIIEGMHGSTFSPIDSIYSKDVTQVYFRTVDSHSFIPGVDPATFVVVDAQNLKSKDKNHSYTGAQVVE